jgi:glycosyltransferase involved in cell wall biosynthesis
MVDTPAKIALYSQAALFACPSIYEPFGIINLEAMACETAVVASAVGGIREVVVDGVTGLLVPMETGAGGSFELKDPVRFEKDFAARINTLMKDEPLRKKMGKAGRERALERFSWSAIAKKTYELYKGLV